MAGGAGGVGFILGQVVWKTEPGVRLGRECLAGRCGPRAAGARVAESHAEGRARAAPASQPQGGAVRGARGPRSAETRRRAGSREEEAE